MDAMIVTTQAGVYGGLALATGASREFIVGCPQAIQFVGRAAGLLFIAVAAITVWHAWTAVPFAK
jgi:hypothetical protein